MVAGQDRAAVPGGGLDARYEQLRHAALNARGDAFGLGFAILTRHGVTAWRQALTELAPDSRPATPVTSSPTAGPTLPGPLAAELVNALAAVAMAGT